MKMLRRAMEDIAAVPAVAGAPEVVITPIVDNEPTDEKSIVMKGPLAEIYANALNVVYAKTDPLTGAPTMESQAQDAAIMQHMAARTNAGPDTSTDVGSFITVYGVAEKDVAEETVIDISTAMAGPDHDNFVLIIDGTRPGANGEAASAPMERIEYLTQAIECLMEVHGGKIFRSLEEYAQSLQPK